MRENIGLYRGKRCDNDEWVYWNIYGELTAENGKRKKYTITKGAKTRCYYYIYQLKQDIIPESIGEYTGLTDKNGKKIFEGDIVEISVCFDSGCYPHTEIRTKVVKIPMFYTINFDGDIEIIGNVTDNPELLKGGAE